MYKGAGGSLPPDLEAPPAPPELLPGAHARLDHLGRVWQEIQGRLCEFSSLLAEVDRNHDYAATGALTCFAYLRHHLNLSAGHAAQQLTLACQLGGLSELEAAFSSGQISYQHAATIASAARKLGQEEILPYEHHLVSFATEATPKELSSLTDHLEHMLDQDGSLGFYEQQHRRNRLEIHRYQDGAVGLRGVFDPLTGETITTAIESMLPPRAQDDHRPAYERRSDALHELCRQHLAGGKGSGRPGQGRRLTVITQENTLKGLQGSPGAELGSGQVIAGALARQMACDCELQMGHVCRDGVHVKLSDTTRLPSPKMYEQLKLRDRCCRIRGCGTKAEHCDAHHIEHWLDNGKTKLENLLLLCARHHTLAHLKGLIVERDPDGAFTAEIAHGYSGP